MKRCSCCKESKSFLDFYKNRRTKDGLSWVCKLCDKENHKKYQRRLKEKGKSVWNNKSPEQKAHRIKKNKERLLQELYALSYAEFETMLIKQNFCCKICNVQTDKLKVDHCHLTGKVRGLLCNSCNLGLGKFQDDPELLEKAVTYLKQ